MPAAGSGCALPAPRTSRSAKASPCSRKSAARNSACPSAAPMWRSGRGLEVRERASELRGGASEVTGARSQHRLGIALVVAAAIAWSTAPFFTRLLAYDSWTILFWRGLFGGGLIAALMVLLQGRAGLQELTRMGKSGWLVASFSTAAMIAFIPSLQLTSVSNVAIIIATGPFLAAALAWVWLREVPRPWTMLASVVALCGVAIILGNARV